MPSFMLEAGLWLARKTVFILAYLRGKSRERAGESAGDFGHRALGLALGGVFWVQKLDFRPVCPKKAHKLRVVSPLLYGPKLQIRGRMHWSGKHSDPNFIRLGLMNNAFSRRTALKGAAWSGAATIAISVSPAHAASDYAYYNASSQSGRITLNGEGNRVLNLFTDIPVAPEPAGFSVGYESGQDADATAQLARLDYYFAVPADAVSVQEPQLLDDCTDYWTEPKLVEETVTTAQGTTPDLTGYRLYVTSFTGPASNPVLQDTATGTWPGSEISLSMVGADAEEVTLYAGYVTSFTTDTGFTRDKATLVQELTVT